MFSDVLLTVDYDRSLTGPDSTIPERNIEAIRYFIENGGSFTVNTGRSLPMAAKNIVGKVPVNAPLLLYNGSADYDAATGQFTRVVPLPLSREVLLTQMQQRFPKLNFEEQSFVAHHLARKDAGWEGYCENNHCTWSYDVPDVPFVKAAFYGEFRENTVASMYEATEEELAVFDEAIAWLEATYGDRLELFRACARIVDIHTKGVSKGVAALELKKKLGKKILVCVGDADNDLAMMDAADFAFCPADGVIADRYETVCKCGDGAVADVIYEKIPEILGFKP